VERHALDQMEITLLQKGKLNEFPCECPRKGNLFEPSQAFVRTFNGTFVVRKGDCIGWRSIVEIVDNNEIASVEIAQIIAAFSAPPKARSNGIRRNAYMPIAATRSQLLNVDTMVLQKKRTKRAFHGLWLELLVTCAQFQLQMLNMIQLQQLPCYPTQKAQNT
jgi:hypothetical protein